MKAHLNQFPVAPMARVLGVCRSGFYRWMKSGVSRISIKQQELDERVKSVFEAHKGRYGAPRVQRELSELGVHRNEKTIAASLKRLRLRAKAAKRFKATTYSDHGLPVAENLLEQDFHADHPNEKYVQDITYISTNEGWLYLAVVIDLYSRQVVGWSMNERMKAGLVCDALTMALFRRGLPKGVIVHSDRGSQYCSRGFQQLVKHHQLRCSMSKKGDCYDNACAETFFHSLKIELIHGARYHTREEAKHAIFEYIETYYNRVRRHSSIGYISPVEFEAKSVA